MHEQRYDLYMIKPRISETRIERLGRFSVVMNTMSRAEQAYPYSYVKIKPGVVILPIRDRQIIAIRQYRIPFDDWLLELPAGMIDDGETPLEAAFRELTEETGYVAGKMEPLGFFYPSQGSTDERVTMFLATNLTQSSTQLDIGEELETVELSHDEMLQHIMDNTFLHSGGIIAYLKYLELSRQK